MFRRLFGISAILVGTLMGAVPALATDVMDFWNEFNSNGMAFRQKYIGHSVTVTGNVWIINGEVTPGYVSLSGANNMGGLLICTVANKASLMPLAKGKPTTVTGTVSSVGPSGIQLKPCSVR
jgi:hypothetical protein